MHRNVEALIGRLATDAELQDRFAESPVEALQEQRLELTEIEMAALAAIRPEDLRAFTASLDARLRKATRRTEMRSAGRDPSMESRNDSRKETP